MIPSNRRHGGGGIRANFSMRLKETGMITTERQTEVKRTAEQLFAQGPDWVTFYREVLGLRGIVRHTFSSRETLAAFEQTPAYAEILQLLTQLRQQGPVPLDTEEPTRMI